MRLNFTKMQGAGNDYIYFNCFKEKINDPSSLAVKLSDRHFGVGGDGIVLICPSDVADAKMRMFNADGSEGKMCGNAIRCVAKYVYENGIAVKNPLRVETLSGVKTLKLIIEDGIVKSAAVDMGKAEFSPSLIPVALDVKRAVGYPVQIAGNEYQITCLSMGNPHCVVFVEDVDNLKLDEIGPQFENAPVFPDRVNTEFVQVLDKNTLKMRVYERGSGETLACGTGACAAAVAAAENGFAEKGRDIRVVLRGGVLVVNYTDERVCMTGPAEKVFEGVVEV